jgi:hypothetical protein
MAGHSCDVGFGYGGTQRACRKRREYHEKYPSAQSNAGSKFSPAASLNVYTRPPPLHQQPVAATYSDLDFPGCHFNLRLN